MYCSHCGKQTIGKICTYCGAKPNKIERYCCSCGAELIFSTKKCPDCGNRAGYFKINMVFSVACILLMVILMVYYKNSINAVLFLLYAILLTFPVCVSLIDRIFYKNRTARRFFKITRIVLIVGCILLAVTTPDFDIKNYIQHELYVEIWQDVQEEHSNGNELELVNQTHEIKYAELLCYVKVETSYKVHRKDSVIETTDKDVRIYYLQRYTGEVLKVEHVIEGGRAREPGKNGEDMKMMKTGGYSAVLYPLL